MHTREQAMSLWCPMNRLTVSKFPACIAEDCAAWRWIASEKTEKKLVIIDHGNGNYSEGYKEMPMAPTHGYCGIAGKSEIKK